ncbi:ParB N-terminal domain-containing protein [Burkholderia sp. 572]|uniref:ParB/Srx family N-terminal domain-containing protein n=1 Tax=Burkholderia sp. 572 TaxID=3156414 RepID=UPI003395AF39
MKTSFWIHMELNNITSRSSLESQNYVMTEARQPVEFASINVDSTINAPTSRADNSDPTLDQLMKIQSERSNRKARAVQEPKQHINESFQDYQKRRAEAGIINNPFDRTETPSRSGWSIAAEVLLSIVGGAPFRIGAGGFKPSVARPSPRPHAPASPRSSVSSISSESAPLIPPSPRSPSPVKPPSLPVKPQITPDEDVGLPIREPDATIPESVVLPESSDGANRADLWEPEPLTQQAWDNQPKDGLSSDLIQTVNDMFEDGQDVRIHISKNNKITYLIKDVDDPNEETYISIDSNETWYRPEMYDYEAISTWRTPSLNRKYTPNENQEYAPIDQFDEGRESLDAGRTERATKGIKEGVLLPPVKVNSVTEGGKTRFKIVDGNHRFRAARELGITSVPYEVVI